MDNNLISIETEDFSQDIENLKEEANNLEDLYTELKEHYDDVKKNSRKMNNGLAFLHLQASNLISLRNNKVNIMKTIIDTKNKKFLNKLKTNALNSPEDNSSENNLFDVIEKLIERIPNDQFMKTVIGNQEDIEDFELDRLLEDRLGDLDSKKVVKEIKEEKFENETEEEELRLISDEFGFIHLVDKDLNEYDLEENGFLINQMAKISLDPKDPNKFLAKYNDIEIDIIFKDKLKGNNYVS